MANIRNRMQSTLHELYRQGKGMKKREDPGHRYIHAQATLDVYLHQSSRYADWLKTVGVKSRCSEAEAAGHVQEYLDWLDSQGRSANTIHTAAAALCKALGLKMADYDKPRRTDAPKKGREPAPSLEGRMDANTDAQRYQRLVKFAAAVGLRRAEYAALRGRDLEIGADGYTYVIVERGKGGKRQRQRVDPVDAAFVQGCFEGVDPDERVFSPTELKNKVNLHRLRREHAQEMYQQYAKRLAGDPGYRTQLLREVRGAFSAAGEDWRRNPDMQRIATSPYYYCRSGVRRSLRASCRPVRYDRLALMAVSVFHLAHWRVDVTVKNYMQ